MIRNALFSKYSVNYRARDWPETFRGFRETQARTLYTLFQTRGKTNQISKQNGQNLLASTQKGS